MSAPAALAVVIAIAVLLFVASMLVLAVSDRLDRRDQARRDAEVRRIVREELTSTVVSRSPWTTVTPRSEYL